MIQFIHTADIHFGMENYGKVDPKTGIHTRLLDFVNALNFCIDTAIEKNVDFFLFAGDAYKTAHPTQTQQRLLMECFLRLYKARIPVIIVVGNHDHPLSFGKANALDIFGQLPVDGFWVINKPTVVNLETKNGPVQILGIPWPTRNTIALKNAYLKRSAHEITEHIAKTVAQIITQKAQELDPAIPAVLSGHLTVSNGIFSGSEKRAIYGTDPTFLPSQLAIEPFDYVALGHLHRYQNLNPKGYPAVVYSGSIERVDFGERKEDKGFCVVTIHKKGKTEHEFIKTPMRPFIQIDVKLEANTNQTQQIIDALKQRTIKDAIIKIVYHIPKGNQDLVDLQAVQRACSQAMYVAGIIPIRNVEIRERRLGATKVEMDLKTLLETFFDNKPEYKDKKDSLIEKALMLAQENQENQQR